MMHFTDEQILQFYKSALVSLEAATALVGRYEQEIHARIDRNGGTAWVNDQGEILLKREHVTPKYDMTYLVALKEHLPDEAIAEVFHDAWDEPKVVHHDAGYNGTKLNMWARTLGNKVTEVMDRARLPGKLGRLTMPDGE